MPSLTRRLRGLLDRRLPLRSRVGLLSVDVRLRTRPRAAYGVRYGRGTVYFTDADLAVDLASFDFAAREGSYATDYDRALVVDIGAHKGYFGAYASVHGAGEVVAYEPERANFVILERTAATYRSAGIPWTMRNAAVDAQPGRAELHVMGASWGHALAPPAAFADYEVAVEAVDVLALSDVLADAASRAKGRRIVVKVNIEGAECSAVLDTEPEAWANVDEVFVETHPWASCGAAELISHLERAGLRAAPSAHAAVVRMRRAARSRFDPHTDST